MLLASRTKHERIKRRKAKQRLKTYSFRPNVYTPAKIPHITTHIQTKITMGAYFPSNSAVKRWKIPSSSVPKIRVKLLHTILPAISLIFLGKIRTNLPQRVKEKLNVHYRASRPCCLWGSGNTRILQSFTTGAAFSHYQSTSNLQEECNERNVMIYFGIILK